MQRGILHRNLLQLPLSGPIAKTNVPAHTHSAGLVVPAAAPLGIAAVPTPVAAPLCPLHTPRLGVGHIALHTHRLKSTAGVTLTSARVLDSRLWAAVGGQPREMLISSHGLQD